VLLRPASPGWIAIRDRMQTWAVLFSVFAATVYLRAYGSVTLFTALLSFLGLKEWLSIIPTRRTDRRVLLYCYLCIVVQYMLVTIRWYGLFVIFIPTFAFLVIAGRMAVLQTTTKNFLRAVATLHYGVIVTVYSISHVAYLMALPAQVNGDRGNTALLFYLLLMTELNDVAQFISGKILSRYLPAKITPLVSPNKTVVGLLGGVVCTAVLGAVLAPVLTPMSRIEAGILGVFGALIGFVGDISMSAVKRDVGVKDTSNLLPGHGGILDRIDSLAYTAPFFLHYLRHFYIHS